MASSAVERRIREEIAEQGRITFARFMQLCLYSTEGGFYSARTQGIDAHFGTSAMAHPAFGALIAKQLDEMWRLLGNPGVFHVVEVGSGDGALARSVVRACRRRFPGLAEALHYVATDRAPRWLHRFEHAAGWDAGVASADSEPVGGIERVRADGLRALRHLEGCILSNELLDNFPVHRFVVEDGRVRELFVTLANGRLSCVAGEPSTPRIEQRLRGLRLSLSEGYRGEVSLAIEDWIAQVVTALDRGFVLTIDYGGLADEVYAPQNDSGTLVCYRRHEATADPLQNPGEQDITCHVDFTSLQAIAQTSGLATVGYARQREFLANLQFESYVEALGASGSSHARATLERMAMMALVDPEQYGDLRVLAQAKGVAVPEPLSGFEPRQHGG